MIDLNLFKTTFQEANTTHASAKKGETVEILDDGEIKDVFQRMLKQSKMYLNASAEKKSEYEKQADESAAQFSVLANTDGETGVSEKEFNAAKTALNAAFKVQKTTFQGTFNKDGSFTPATGEEAKCVETVDVSVGNGADIGDPDLLKLLTQKSKKASEKETEPTLDRNLIEKVGRFVLRCSDAPKSWEIHKKQ